MRSVVPMKTAKIGYLVISVLFCVLGIVLIAAPGTSVVWLGRLLGIGMIVFGAIKLVGYFQETCSVWHFSMIWRSAFC